MALKHFGKPDNDLGTWYDFGEDRPFRLRVRRIPASVVERIDERRKPTSFEVRDGMRRPVRDLEAVAEGLVEKATWAWTDAEGLEIEVADQEGAAFWSRQLGREVAVGETVSPSGKELTAEAKRLVIQELKPFARVIVRDAAGTVQVDETGRPREQWLEVGVFIVGKAAEMQRDFVGRQQEKEKN